MVQQVRNNNATSEADRYVATALKALAAVGSVVIIAVVILLAIPSLVTISLVMIAFNHPKFMLGFIVTLVASTLAITAINSALRNKSKTARLTWLLCAFFPVLMLSMFFSGFVVTLL